MPDIDKLPQAPGPDMEVFECFTWTWPSGQMMQWNVTQIWKCIQNNPELVEKHVVTLEDMELALELNHEKDFNLEYVMSTDTNKPGLLVPDPTYTPNGYAQQMILVDGWHRMKKCSILRIPTFTLYVLSPAQERHCRVDHSKGPLVHLPDKQ